MRKLVYGAVALALAGIPAFASENEWSSLDKEIDNLSSSLSAQNAPGPKISGYIRTSFRYSNDEDALFGGPPNDEEESGFKLDRVRVELSGEIGQGYTYKVTFEMNGGSASLRDAFLCWKVTEDIKGIMGQFKKPILRSTLIGDTRLLFQERTALGGFYDPREPGIMFTGTFDLVEWWLAVQNGIDGKEDDYNYTIRVLANLMGGGVGNLEGAYGADDEMNLTVGAAFAEEQELDDGKMIAVEAALTSGPFSVAAELVDFDDGTADSFPSKGGSFLHWGSKNTFVNADPAGATVWDVTASYLFTDQYEAALRYEDADDDDDTTALSACVNRYVQGHDIKWTLQYLHTDSDLDSNEIDEYTLGLTGGF